MNFSILKMSEYARNRLSHCSCGQIHSIYQKTINLSTDRGLIALQTAESPLSPISLITGLDLKGMQTLPLCQGSPVTFFNNGLEISGSGDSCVFHFEQAEVYNLELPGPLPEDQKKKLAENIATVLSHSKTGGFDTLFASNPPSQLSLMLQAAQKRIMRCSRLYRLRDYSDAAEELSRLLGLGIGLTPSGDDFLCGVLAGLRLSGCEETLFARILKKEIAVHLKDTIDISAAFLACALDNQYSLAVNLLHTVPSSDSILAVFSSIGHSSGIDTLCGVLYVLGQHSPAEA